MKYLLLARLWDSTFATHHKTLANLEREVALIEEENGFKLNFIDPTIFDEDCCLSDYPEGTALAIKFEIPKIAGKPIDSTSSEIEESKEEYLSPFTGRLQ